MYKQEIFVAVLYDFVRASTIGHHITAAMLIGHDQLDAARDGFMNEFHHRVAIRFLDHFADDVPFASNRTDCDVLCNSSESVLLYQR